MAVQIEATLDAVRDKLAAGLNAKIDVINAEITDGHALAYPTAILTGADNAHDYPRVYVLPEDTETATDTGGVIIWRHRIRVVSFVTDIDTAALTRILMRYQRAVRDVILAGGRDVAGGGFGVIHERDEYGPVFDTSEEGYPEGQFVQGAATLLVVRQEQTLS